MRTELKNILDTVFVKERHSELDPESFIYSLRLKNFYTKSDEDMIIKDTVLAKRRLRFVEITKGKQNAVITELIKELQSSGLDAADCFIEELKKANLHEYIPPVSAPPRLPANEYRPSGTQKHIPSNNVKKILVIGSTGNGKSALCNRIITPHGKMESENFFEESDDILSETKETIGREGTWNGMKVFVIDTPGMNDSDGVEAKHLIAMIDYLKNQHDIHAVLLVFNAQQDRFDSNIQRLICLLTTVFNSPEFWDHVALVFTKTFASVKINIEKKQQRHGEFVAKIVQSTGLSAIKKPLSYFVDSKDFQDVNTKDNLSFLSAWINKLDAIGTQKLQQPDEKYLTNNYTKMREMTEELELKNKEIKKFTDQAAREKKANELLGAVNGAPWGGDWPNTDRGSRNCSFTFEGRQINAFEEKWINKDFARIVLTDAQTGQSTEGTAGFSGYGGNSYEVRRSKACRAFINLGFTNGWWTIE